MKEQTTRTPPKLRVLSAFLAVAMLLTLQSVQHRIRHRQDVGCVIDGLHAAEDGEGEQGDHQEIQRRWRSGRDPRHAGWISSDGH